MSLSEQTARVAGGGKNTLKTILQKLGVSVGEEPIDQYPTLAAGISDKLLPDKLLSAETAGLYGLSGTAVSDDVFRILSRYHWKLIQAYRTAGAVEFTVPDGVSLLGVYLVGAGGGGGANKGNASLATGGASGYGKNVVLKVTPGQKISGVVGAKGIGGKWDGTAFKSSTNGGATSFGEVTANGGEAGKRLEENGRIGASGGQGSDGPCKDPMELISLSKPVYKKSTYGSVSSDPRWGDQYGDSSFRGGDSQPPKESQNAFDPLMVTLSAGGWAYASSDEDRCAHEEINPLPDKTKGGNGSSQDSQNAIGGNATGNGNGGGAACVYSATYTATGGNGSAGMILIYTLAFEEDWA